MNATYRFPSRTHTRTINTGRFLSALAVTALLLVILSLAGYALASSASLVEQATSQANIILPAPVSTPDASAFQPQVTPVPAVAASMPSLQPVPQPVPVPVAPVDSYQP